MIYFKATLPICNCVMVTEILTQIKKNQTIFSDMKCLTLTTEAWEITSSNPLRPFALRQLRMNSKTWFSGPTYSAQNVTKH